MTQPVHNKLQTIRCKPSPHRPTGFRPIAPLASLPSPASGKDETEKRKWEGIDGPSEYGQASKLLFRKGSSPSSDGDPSLSDLTADQKQRRKEQNRAAQRAFRERKERYVKELEDQIRAMKASHEETVARLQQENIELRALLKRATSGEMDSVNDASLAMDLSLTKLQDTDVDMPTLKAESNRSSRSNPPPVALPTGFSQPTMVEPPVRQTSSAVACIRDKDGVSFCERLKEEVCSSAYNQLLSEPLFDASGTLNNESTSHPIPILTELLPDDEKARETHRMNMMDQFDKFAASLSGRLDQHPQVDNFNSGGALLTCRTVWERINAHPKFDRFDVEELCLELKKKAKCSSTGPIFLEEEVKEVLALMDRKS